MQMHVPTKHDGSVCPLPMALPLPILPYKLPLPTFLYPIGDTLVFDCLFSILPSFPTPMFQSPAVPGYECSVEYAHLQSFLSPDNEYKPLALLLLQMQDFAYNPMHRIEVFLTSYADLISQYMYNVVSSALHCQDKLQLLVRYPHQI